MENLEDVKPIGDDLENKVSTIEDEVEKEDEDLKMKKPVRIVEMEDGQKVNFGVRSNLVTGYDVKTGELVFKIVTGQIITFLAPEFENLSDFQAEVYLYGLLNKVKVSLSGTKPEDLAKSISEQLDALAKKEFSVRTYGETGESELNSWQRAFAIVVSKTVAGKEHWKDIENVSVVREVIEAWNDKSVAERNNIKRHPLVMQEHSEWEIEQGMPDMDVFL